MKGGRKKFITIYFLFFTILFSFFTPIKISFAFSNEDTVTITFNPKVNEPPNKPINPNPPDGKTDVIVPVELSVDIFDNTGTYVDVFFYNASSNTLIGVDYNVPSDWSTATVVWNESIKGRICYWYAIAMDHEGLQNQSDTWIFATRPNQPSVIHNNEYPQNGSTNILLNVTCHIQVSDEDADLMTIYWYENSTGAWVERQRNSSAQNGTYYWTFQQATDCYRTYYWKVAVNTSLHNTTAIFHFRTIDNEPLTLSNPIPENRSTDISVATPYWYVTIEDPENDTINWTIEISPSIGNTSQNNDVNGQKPCPLSGMVADTTYIVYVNATDSWNGTWINETFWFVTANESVPTISNEYPPNKNTYVSLQPLCHVDVHDLQGDNLNVYWYENSVGNWTLRQNNTNVTANSTVYWTYSQASSYSTTYYWKVVVDDGAYNTTGIYYFTTRSKPAGPPQPPSGGGYTPPPNQHPIANITGPHLGYIEENLVFYAYYSYDRDGYIIRYRWDFNNDGEYDTDWLEDFVISHSYNETGNYSVRLQVKDNMNAITTSDPILIQIVEVPSTQKLPIANIDGSYSGFIGENISFSSKGSYDPDGYIINYTWDFGDGNISYLENPVHSYNKPGRYTVTLTVKDNDNLTNSTIITNVIIKDKEDEKEQPSFLILALIMAIVATILIIFIRSKSYRFTLFIEKVNKQTKKNGKSLNFDVILEKIPKEENNTSTKISNIEKPELDNIEKK